MRSLLALLLIVHHLNSSLPTNIRKVHGLQKGMIKGKKKCLGWLNACLTRAGRALDPHANGASLSKLTQ